MEGLEHKSRRDCAKVFAEFDKHDRRDVMAQLCFERIAQKQEFIAEILHQTNDWNHTAYFMLMRGLDIRRNRKAYEYLSNILPYRYIYAERKDLAFVEAMLLGCAGLLHRLVDATNHHPEVVERYKIFEYNAHKYGLEQMRIDDWELSQLRSENHPIIRLLQVAKILKEYDHLLDTLLSCRTPKDVERIFCLGEAPKWAQRLLGVQGGTGAMTRNKAHLLGVNVVAQMQILYSEYTMREDLDSRGLELLEQLPAEKNTYINRWNGFGVAAENALESQALLQLYTNYCVNAKCDNCPLMVFADARCRG